MKAAVLTLLLSVLGLSGLVSGVSTHSVQPRPAALQVSSHGSFPKGQEKTHLFLKKKIRFNFIETI